MSCEACLTLPTVQPTGYKTKGSYEKISGLDVYVTGSTSATKGIIDIYDVFGMASQTLQGADIMASTLNALVLVPDFFHGEAAKHEWLPPNTDQKREALTEFMTKRAAFPPNVETLLQITKDAKEKYSSVTAWGSFGLCWGGKIVALASGSGSPFKVSGQTHPGRLAKEDAVKIAIPHIVLASKDEPADAVADYKEVIGSNATGGVVETYSTMHHGWMGARANLEDPANLKEYERGYKQMAEFFHKHL